MKVNNCNTTHPFIAKYPLELTALLMTPLIVRESVRQVVELPHPTVAGLRPLAEYGGYSYGALRTALSRLRKKGCVISFKGEDQVTRLRLTDFFNYVTQHYTFEREEDGFTLAVFPEGAGGGSRYRLRNELETFGFRPLAPGAFIAGRLDTDRFMAELQKMGAAQNVFLFQCGGTEDEGMMARIKALWDLDLWERRITEFQEDIHAFLTSDALDVAELYNRVYYAGPAFFKYIQRQFPRLPSRHYPARRVLSEVQAFMGAYSAANGERLVQRYLEINGRGANPPGR